MPRKTFMSVDSIFILAIALLTCCAAATTGTDPLPTLDIPSLITSLSCDWDGVVCNFGQVTAILWDAKKLRGSIPTVLGELRSLEEFDLEGNSDLSGTLPTELGKLINLTIIHVEQGQLTGTIPSEVGRLQKLTRTDFEVNGFSGKIPSEVGKLTNLERLYLDNCKLTGTLPSELGNLINVRRIRVNSNNLIGTLPQSLGKLQNLQRFYVNHNQLSGKIPDELGALDNLNDVQFYNNNFLGSVSEAVMEKGICGENAFLIISKGSAHTSCSTCPEWSLSPAGSVAASACKCNVTGIQGLRNYGAGCGCDDGMYLNRKEFRCVVCVRGERCVWNGNYSKSASPPEVLPGFWTTAWSTPSIDFVENTVYECLGRKTCPQADKKLCAIGRAGIGCSECVAGYFGGSVDGPCFECTTSDPGNNTLALVLAFVTMVVAVGAILVTMAFLSKPGAKSSFLVALEANRVIPTVTRFMEFLQRFALVSYYSIEMPREVLDIFSIVKVVELKLDFFGLTCLTNGQQQSVESAFAFQYLWPVLAFLAFCLACCAALICKSCLGRNICPPQAALVKFAQLYTIFSASIMRGAIGPLLCVTHPSGDSTIAAYPEVDCSSDRYNKILPWSIIGTVVYVFGYFAFLCVAIRAIARSRLDSLGDERNLRLSFRDQERGPLAFVGFDYRGTTYYWPLVVFLIDIFLIVSPAFFPSDGLAQCLATAAVIVTTSALQFWASPIGDNVLANWLDGCMNFSLAILLVVLAASGFVGMEGYEAIEQLDAGKQENPEFNVRVARVLAVMVFSLAVAGSTVLIKMIMMVPWTRKNFPIWFLPFEDPRRKEAAHDVVNEITSYGLHDLVDRMDEVEFHSFLKLITQASTAQGKLKRRGFGAPSCQILESYLQRGKSMALPERKSMALPEKQTNQEEEPPPVHTSNDWPDMPVHNSNDWPDMRVKTLCLAGASLEGEKFFI